jgi:hypothetical protein
MQVFEHAVRDITDGFLVRVPAYLEAVLRPSITDFGDFRRDRIVGAGITGSDRLRLGDERIHADVVNQRIHVGAGDFRPGNGPAESAADVIGQGLIVHERELVEGRQSDQIVPRFPPQRGEGRPRVEREAEGAAAEKYIASPPVGSVIVCRGNRILIVAKPHDAEADIAEPVRQNLAFVVVDRQDPRVVPVRVARPVRGPLVEGAGRSRIR